MGKNKKGLTAVPVGYPPIPFPLRDSTSILGASVVVVDRTVGGWLCICTAHAIYPFLTSVTILDSDVATHEATMGKRFFVSADAFKGGSEHYLEAYKRFALKEGATPEAIRLLGIYQPLTSKEVKKMAKAKAEKATKTKTPKTAKTGEDQKKTRRKSSTAKAKTGDDDAPKTDDRKISNVAKENPYREGSKRAESWDALKGAKTVEDYKANGGAGKYISRWESEGLIKLT